MSREAMQQALPLIERLRDEADLCRHDGATDVAALLDEAAAALAEQAQPVATADASLGAAIEAIDAALAEQAQPVAWYDPTNKASDQAFAYPDARDKWPHIYKVPLYTTPPAPVVPTGWRMVPVEPTEAMLRAALAEQAQPVSECADNDSPWLICKPCAASGKCVKEQAQPVATLHDDGCFTWTRDEFRRRYDRQRAGWRMDVYATPPTPVVPQPLTGWELARVIADAGADELAAVSGTALLRLIRAVEAEVRKRLGV